MGFARSVARASINGSSGIATPEKWVEDWFAGGAATAAGIRVTADTAMEYSAFFGGVRVISEDLGGLPLHVYERLERGKRRATEHSLYPLLHDAPNDMMASVQLREVIQGHAMTWGDGVVYVVSHPRTGVIEELWPLRPDRLTIKVRRDGPGRFQRFYDYDDGENGIQARLSAEQVLHVSGLGFDGVRGYSIIRMARNSIGLGLATEKYGSAFFGNGARPGGVLQHPGTVTEPARKRIKADWENLHKGLDRAQRVAILEEGVTWQTIGIPPEDAQFLETRKLQVTEMARWLRLPPHKIGDLERATFSNIEQQQLDYVTTALRIWLVRWEQAILTQLVAPFERRQFFVEHLVDGLLRGDTQARYQAYAVGRQWGWLSADDVREIENQNPLPDGKGEVYMVPLNMVPAPSPDDAELPPVRSLRELPGRSSATRRRIAAAFKPLITDADERIAKLERSEVTALARKHLGRERSVSAFVAAIVELYNGTIRERMTDRWLPIFSAFAAQIAADAAEDVAHEDEIDLERWVEAYVISHVGYRVMSALGQLTKLADSAADDEAAAAAVAERLDQWVTDRPAITGRWEATQMSNAAAREAWRVAGIVRLKWVISGDSCPYCTGLDGTVVGIEKPFLAKGDELQDGDQTLVVDRDTFHPPAHPGCDCEVVPG